MTPRGRILIVDDEVNARTALAEILRDEGYAVDTAGDGFKALPKLDDFAPDAVVTDLRMPGMDGLELMQRVRDRDPDIPVVVVTAYGAVESAVQAMRRGAADYVTKPVNVKSCWWCWTAPWRRAACARRASACGSGWRRGKGSTPWWARALPCGRSWRTSCASPLPGPACWSRGRAAPARS